MSVVTNVIILAEPLREDEELLAEINSFFEPRQLGFNDMAESFGGNKEVESAVFGGAFNYFDLTAFCSHLKKISRADDCVHLFVKGQQDSHWREEILK